MTVTGQSQDSGQSSPFSSPPLIPPPTREPVALPLRLQLEKHTTVREYEIFLRLLADRGLYRVTGQLFPTPGGPRGGSNFLKAEGILLVKPWKGNPKERKPKELTS